MEYQNEDGLRFQMRIQTMIKCSALRLRMKIDDVTSAFVKAEAAVRKMKDTCDKNEIRRIPDEPPTSEHRGSGTA